MGGNAWLIVDWLDGQGVLHFTSLLHFYPTFEVVAGGDRALVRSRACRFAVIPVGSTEPRASVSRGDHPQFPGWFSPEFGVKFPVAVLALNWTGLELPWIGGALDHQWRGPAVPADGGLARRRACALGILREDLRLANEMRAESRDHTFTGPTGKRTSVDFSRRLDARAQIRLGRQSASIDDGFRILLHKQVSNFLTFFVLPTCGSSGREVAGERGIVGITGKDRHWPVRS